MEAAIVRACNRFGIGRIDPLTELVCAVPFLIALWVGLILAAVVHDRPRGRQVFFGVLVAVALHAVITEGLLKHALTLLLPMRVRPYLAHPGEITPIGTLFSDSSFPSSHCASTAAIVTVFARQYAGAWAAALGFVLLMDFSRMHNGMHYPTDVLTGSLLGLGYGLLAVMWVTRRTALGQALAAAPAKPGGGRRGA